MSDPDDEGDPSLPWYDPAKYTEEWRREREAEALVLHAEWVVEFSLILDRWAEQSVESALGVGYGYMLYWHTRFEPMDTWVAVYVRTDDPQQDMDRPPTTEGKWWVFAAHDASIAPVLVSWRDLVNDHMRASAVSIWGVASTTAISD